jgi:hypothetical protein
MLNHLVSAVGKQQCLPARRSASNREAKKPKKEFARAEFSCVCDVLG